MENKPHSPLDEPVTVDLDESDKENIPQGGNERKRKKSSPSMIFCSP